MNSLIRKGKIGNVEIKNRIVMAPISIGLGTKDKTIGKETIAFYEKRAKGNVGLIILGAIEINDYNGAFEHNGIQATKEEHIEGFNNLVKKMHEYDTKVFAQVGHPGRQTFSTINKDNHTVAPSKIRCKVCRTETKQLSLNAIKTLQSEFVNTARVLKKSGIDGIEIHGAHGYLINQFLSPYSNKRTDKYGGSLENRCRFVKEILEKIKEEVGENYPIGIRLSVEEYLHEFNIDDEGINLAEGLEIAKYMEEIGFTYINVSSGIYETTNTIVEPSSYEQGWRINLAEEVKNEVKIPVMAASVIREPAYANKLLEENILDFVLIGRGLVADPLWGLKAIEGRTKEIVPCISCLNCLEKVYEGSHIKCSVNYEAGREYHQEELSCNGRNKEVAIIGAGPAGLEAARILSIRGYKPIIFERNKEIGGQLQYAKMPPNKEKISWLIDYYKEIVKKHEIEVKLDWQGDLKDIKKIKPYKYIFANGSDPVKPDIYGLDGVNVFSYKEVLNEKNDIKNKRICILGSGLNGLETALFLAEKENEVIVVEIEAKIGAKIYTPNKIDILKRLEKYNVRLISNVILKETWEHKITLKHKNKKTKIDYPIDYLVVSTGVAPKIIYTEAELKKDKYYVIGDAKKIGKIVDAVKDGYIIGSIL